MNTNTAIDKLIRDLSPKMREALTTGVNGVISFLASRATWDALARRGLLVSHENVRGNVHTTRKLNVEGQKARAILLDLANLNWPEARKMNDEFDAKQAAKRAAVALAEGPRFPEGTPEHEAYATELRAELAKWSAGEPPYPFVAPKICGARAIWDSGLACSRAPHDDNAIANPLGWMHTWEGSSISPRMAEIVEAAHKLYDALAQLPAGMFTAVRPSEAPPAGATWFEHDGMFRPGFVAGDCGHAVAVTEWLAGFRDCGRCPSAFGALIEQTIGGVPSALARLVDGVWRPLRVGEHVRGSDGGSFAVEGVALINGALWVIGAHEGAAARAPIGWPAVGTLAWRPVAGVEPRLGAATMIETDIDGCRHVLVVSAPNGTDVTPVAAGDVITNADGERFRVGGLFRSGRRSWADGEFVEAPGVAGAARIGRGSAFGLWWKRVEAASDGPADPSAGLAVIPSDAPLISYDEDREVARHLASKVNQCGYAPGVPAYELAQAILRGYVEHVTPEGLDELRRGAGELS